MLRCRGTGIACFDLAIARFKMEHYMIPDIGIPQSLSDVNSFTFFASARLSAMDRVRAMAFSK